jgi:hypothetical protein
MIQGAREAVGESDPKTDWKIVLSEHAKMFEVKAPSLAKNLRGARPKGLAEIYEERDSNAGKAQDKFKMTASKADLAIFCTASLGALLLVAGGLQGLLGESIGPRLVKAIGLLGLVPTVLAGVWIDQIRRGAFSQRWVQERVGAEAARVMYFKTVITETSSDPQDQLFTLEYVRRFLLDSQMCYFKKRGGEHEEAAGAALKDSTYAAGAASLLTALAGALALMWRPELAVVAGLGVIASAYAALVASRSALNQDRRNADRYLATAYQLKERELEIQTYRERTASGDTAAVPEFFAPVFSTLEADHKAFSSGATHWDSAITDMQARLEAAKTALKEKPAKEAGAN